MKNLYRNRYKERIMRLSLKNLIGLSFLYLSQISVSQSIEEIVEHKYAVNDGTSIHYVKAGTGPLMVFIHGFPDYWYGWREQLMDLSDKYTVVAMDTRGYNLSDKPSGYENYSMNFLVEDVEAVIRNENQEKAIIVGHDWGGGIAWSFAGLRPEMTHRLIIFNLPHIKRLQAELAKFESQHEASGYARNFQSPNSHERLTAEGLATALSRGDSEIKSRYLEAFQKSSLDAMMNYYRANFPREPYTEGQFLSLPKIQAPVLQFHGLKDTALLPSGLNNTWEEIESDWTLMTLPTANHWSHLDEAKKVNKMIRAWLDVQQE